jgi:hypothetical protein
MSMTRVIKATDPEFIEAHQLIVERGVRVDPSSGDYTAPRLSGELESRGWSWKLNVDDYLEGPGEFAYAEKALITPPHGSFSIAEKGETTVVALTVVLARAIRFDDERKAKGLPPR